MECDFSISSLPRDPSLALAERRNDSFFSSHHGAPMQKLVTSVLVVVITNLQMCSAFAQLQKVSAVGIFDQAADIGEVGKPGKVLFDADKSTYSVSGGGANMWFATDALHFVSTRASGDVSIAADIHWPSKDGDPHRKACLILRQSLSPDSAYVDVAFHGDGLCSIQYREFDGDATHEVQSNVSAPSRVRLEKRGDYVAMFIGERDDNMRPSGGSFRIPFKEPFFVGLGVCAHNNERLETAVFSNVVLKKELPKSANQKVECTLETISIASSDRKVLYHSKEHIEAPNWLPSGQSILFNSTGRIFSIPIKGGNPTQIGTGSLNRSNNDHGISPDGKTLVISDQTQSGGSRIYTLPIEGGTPQLITKLAPSYWHGWSPNGKTLAYCASRSGEFDIYTIPVDGGEETRLTTSAGLDDGPDYSPDGKSIYFNSDRTGKMHIWRMNIDGTEQTQITADEFNNWFPHPSPDGRWIVFVSFAGDVEGHPANKDVSLRLMSLTDGKIKILAKLFGGQGTLNVPSWSPDSRNLAFVSYQQVSQ